MKVSLSKHVCAYLHAALLGDLEVVLEVVGQLEQRQARVVLGLRVHRHHRHQGTQRAKLHQADLKDRLSYGQEGRSDILTAREADQV